MDFWVDKRRAELKVKLWIDKSHNDYLLYNRKVWGCPKAYRPDFLYISYQNSECWFIILEIDEDQHKSYDKVEELNRIKVIAHTLQDRCWIIRYNPDSYKVDQKIKQIKFSDRMNVLNQILEYCKKTPPSGNIEQFYLYYDGFMEPCSCILEDYTTPQVMQNDSLKQEVYDVESVIKIH